MRSLAAQTTSAGRSKRPRPSAAATITPGSLAASRRYLVRSRRIGGWPSSGRSQASVTAWGMGRLAIHPRASGSRRRAHTRRGWTGAFRPPGSRPANATVRPGSPCGKFPNASQAVMTSRAVHSGVVGGGGLEPTRVVADQGHLAQVQRL